MVCREDFEERHPSDFLRVQKEKINVDFSRPYPAQDNYIPENLTLAPQDFLGIPEQLVVNYQKIINPYNIHTNSALNDSAIDIFALNSNGTSPISIEAINLTEHLLIVLARFLNDSISISEAIKFTVNKIEIESLPIGESLHFTETEHSIDSLSLSESKLFTVGKGITENIAISESIRVSFNRSLSETLSITEGVTKTDNEKTIESLSLAETNTFSVSKTLTESITLAENISYTLLSSTALNGASLNKITLG